MQLSYAPDVLTSTALELSHHLGLVNVSHDACTTLGNACIGSHRLGQELANWGQQPIDQDLQGDTDSRSAQLGEAASVTKCHNAPEQAAAQ